MWSTYFSSFDKYGKESQEREYIDIKGGLFQGNPLGSGREKRGKEKNILEDIVCVHEKVIITRISNFARVSQALVAFHFFSILIFLFCYFVL
jgi:hypothetical protein